MGLETLKDWIKNLVFIILFTTFLEQLLPDSKMRGYVKVAMGFFVISILISPLFSIFNQNHNSLYDTLLFQNNLKEVHWEEIQNDGEKLNEYNQSLIKEYYEEDIKEKVNNILNLEYPQKEKDIDVTLNKDFQIDKIKIFLEQNSIEEVEIDPVDIIEKKSEKTNESKGNNNIFLREKLGHLLQLPENKILIIEDER
ncbi:MAG: stage III sporulation protein AF [Halanaerobiales bacterium]